MSKEASQTAKSSSQDNDAVVATVLSMKLKNHAKSAKLYSKARPPANIADEADDLWDNVPV